MSYRPRMKSSVRSIVPVHDVNYLQFDHMVIDHWQVEAIKRISYASQHLVSLLTSTMRARHT